MVKFPTILKETDRLFKEVESYLKVHEATVLPEASYERFVAKLAQVMGCPESLMSVSCLSVKTSPLTIDILYPLLWRLAANKERLHTGYPVLYYPKYSFSGTEEIRFDSVVYKNGKYKTTVRVLTGPYAFGTFTCKFTDNGLNMIFPACGYCGRKYKVGRKDACLVGLFALADLVNVAEDPRIFQKIISDDDIIAFNRKHIISLREGKASCPYDRGGACVACPEFPRKCLASYREFSYYD